MSLEVEVRGRRFAVQLPPLDLREDLIFSYGSATAKMAQLRVAAAALGLSVSDVAASARGVSVNPRADLFGFGGEVYNVLRGKGWTAGEVLAAGTQVLGLILPETFPRQAEVEAARGN